MKNWNELTTAQKCFNGLSKQEVLTKEHYNLLKEDKDFRVKNGVIENIPDEININDNDFIVYTHKDKGVLIGCNGAYVAVTYEDFNKGYEHIMSVWED